jgi:hypothetical protein
MARRRQDQGISVVLNKRLDLSFALSLENRTGAIEQAAPRLDQGPKGLQQFGLYGSQLRHIRLSAQPTHVGMAPANA